MVRQANLAKRRHFTTRRPRRLRLMVTPWVLEGRSPQSKATQSSHQGTASNPDKARRTGQMQLVSAEEVVIQSATLGAAFHPSTRQRITRPPSTSIPRERRSWMTPASCQSSTKRQRASNNMSRIGHPSLWLRCPRLRRLPRT